MLGYSKIASVAAALALLSTSALADNVTYVCKELIKAGLFDTTDIDRNEAVYQSQKTAYCKSKKYNFSGNATVPVEGVPIDFSSAFGHSNDSCEQSESVHSSNLALRISLRRANSELVAAFNRCLDKIPPGLRAYVQHTPVEGKFLYRLDFSRSRGTTTFDTRKLKTSENIKCAFQEFSRPFRPGQVQNVECTRHGGDGGYIRASDEATFVDAEYAVLELPKTSGGSGLGPVEIIGPGNGGGTRFNASQCAYLIQLESNYTVANQNWPRNTLLPVNYSEPDGGSIRHMISPQFQFIMYYNEFPILRGNNPPGPVGMNAATVYRQCKLPPKTASK